MRHRRKIFDIFFPHQQKSDIYYLADVSILLNHICAMTEEREEIRHPDAPLKGSITLPGDKSVGFRAILLGGLAADTEVRNLPLTPLVHQGLRAVNTLGCSIRTDRSGRIYLGKYDPGISSAEIDCGGSATLMRLLAGLLAGVEGEWRLRGNEQLAKRPMERIAEPLRLMGAEIETTGGYPPLTIKGGKLKGIDYETPVLSAQVKSAILLAAIHARGETMVAERMPTRDHTERMLIDMGADIKFMKDGKRHRICIQGRRELRKSSLFIPGDISSSAYIIAAAVMLPGSDIIIKDVLLNTTRTAFLNHLMKMGADIEVDLAYPRHFEPYGNLRVRGGDKLSNAHIMPSDAVGMVDEIPLLAMVGASADGVFEVRGMSELRVKESDRIASTVHNLKALGIKVDEWGDGFSFDGGAELHPAEFDSFGDHRVALACKVAGAVHFKGCTLRNPSVGEASFPEFDRLIDGLTSA